MLLFRREWCILLSPANTPARSPNLNGHAERWVWFIKEECLSNLILFGETSLRRGVLEFLAHYHHEHNCQRKGNVILSPASPRGGVGTRARGGNCMSGAAGQLAQVLHPHSVMLLQGLRRVF